jgi:hypothetical protein
MRCLEDYRSYHVQQSIDVQLGMAANASKAAQIQNNHLETRPYLCAKLCSTQYYRVIPSCKAFVRPQTPTRFP